MSYQIFKLSYTHTSFRRLYNEFFIYIYIIFFNHIYLNKHIYIFFYLYIYIHTRTYRMLHISIYNIYEVYTYIYILDHCPKNTKHHQTFYYYASRTTVSQSFVSPINELTNCLIDILPVSLPYK